MNTVLSYLCHISSEFDIFSLFYINNFIDCCDQACLPLHWGSCSLRRTWPLKTSRQRNSLTIQRRHGRLQRSTWRPWRKWTFPILFNLASIYKCAHSIPVERICSTPGKSMPCPRILCFFRTVEDCPNNTSLYSSVVTLTLINKIC